MSSSNIGGGMRDARGGLLNDSTLTDAKENLYFMICAGVSVCLCLLLIIPLMIYGIPLIIFFILSQAYFVGHIKGNGVKLSESQFPEIYRLASSLSDKMGMVKTPEIYMLQEGGFINAFATRFTGRDFVVLYSELVEFAYALENDSADEDVVAFVLAHELAHVKKQHTGLLKTMLTLPCRIIPFLYQAYSRACERTCDKYGQAYAPSGATKGLMALSAGRHLYQKVNAGGMISQATKDYDLCAWFYEISSTHPPIVKRLADMNMRAV